MKLNLKLQLILAFVFISFLLAISLYLISAYTFQKQFQTYMIEQQDIKNEEIRQIITNAYSSDGKTPDLSFFKEFGNTLLDQKLILSVYDKNDHEIFCISCTNGEKCNHAINNAEEIMKGIYPGFHGDYTEKKLSIVKEDRYLGYITIGYYGPFFYNENEESFIKTYNNLFIIISTLAFILSVFLGLVIANKIANPLKKVIDKTKDISNGNYTGKIKINSFSKEIEELANSVNHLTDNLNEQLIIKKQMAGDFTHEFLTPLTTIKSNIEALIDGIYDVTPERLENLKLEVERLARMIYEINKLVDIENTLILEKIDFDLASEISKVLNLFEKELVEKEITVNFNAKKCLIYASQDKINQVLINLVNNAIKYSNKKGTIDIEINQNRSATIFTIRDNGIGIRKKDIPYVFEYLYRVDKSRTRDTGGSGIGLYVVKNIVEHHNGTVKVESTVNKGSAFIVTLPKK